jgi:hypothetical protein
MTSHLPGECSLQICVAAADNFPLKSELRLREGVPSQPVRSVTLALHAFAQQLAVPSNGLGLFPRAPFRWLFVVAPKLHFSEYPFALHLLFQGSQRLIDIVIANEDLHGGLSPQRYERHSGRQRGWMSSF